MITSSWRKVIPFIVEHLNIDIPTPDRGSVIGWIRNGEVVSGVVYERFTGTSIAASIVNKPGSMFSTRFLWTIFDYPFNQLKVKKIIVYIRGTNHKSIAMVERMGFVKHSEMEDVFPDGSMVIYTIEKHQCKYLRDRYYGKRHENA